MQAGKMRLVAFGEAGGEGDAVFGAGLGINVDQDVLDGYGSNSLHRSCITNA
jgi:hypothetical protein